MRLRGRCTTETLPNPTCKIHEILRAVLRFLGQIESIDTHLRGLKAHGLILIAVRQNRNERESDDKSTLKQNTPMSPG